VGSGDALDQNQPARLGVAAFIEADKWLEYLFACSYGIVFTRIHENML